jgi:hypothetical protein
VTDDDVDDDDDDNNNNNNNNSNSVCLVEREVEYIKQRHNSWQTIRYRNQNVANRFKQGTKF